MATPPPPGHSKRKFTGNAWQEAFKRLRPNLQSSSAATGSPANSAPGAISTSPSPPATPGPSLAITPPPAHAHTVSGASGSTASSSSQAAATAQAGARHGMADKFKQATVAGLESALRALHISASAIPGIKPAVDGLIDCLDVVQAATSSAEEYDEIISNLNIIAASLKEYVDELGLEDPSGNPACSLIAWCRNIEKEVARIQEQKDRNKIRRALEAVEDKEHVMKCYRRVEGLFQQLQSNICLQTLKNTNKHRLTSLLDRLHPVSDARYDSRYSTTVRRRGCTKETREQVQADLQNWVQDPSSANIYWMNGMAGTGKTTIAYSLCEWLETQKRLGASFFCSRVSPLCRAADLIIPTIAYELARYSPAFRAELGNVLEEDTSMITRGVARQFEKLIHGPMTAAKNAIPHGVVVVVDALDECEDADCVRQILQELLRLGANLPLKYFVASRPEPIILKRMRGLPEQSRAVLHLHDIEQSIVEGDIKKYLEESLGGMSPPPDVKQIDELAKLAGKLFIYAATATRYILPGMAAVNPAARLKAVIAARSRTTNEEATGKRYKQLDELYTTVLATALDENILESHEVEAAKLVLWTVVCAAEPMTISTLTSFLSLNNTQVPPVVESLRSVLHVSESTGLVSTLHASFPDFLLDRSRSGKYHCNPLQHGKHLAHRCFDIMQAQLRFNICNLESSFMFDKGVADLELRVAEFISKELSYACFYWTEHLRHAGFSNELHDRLSGFLTSQLLFWMEVLNVKKTISKGIPMISQVEKWLPTGRPNTLNQLLVDIKSFVTRFAAGACSRSTPHLYVSALPFCEKSNLVYVHYWPRMRGLIDPRGTATIHRTGAELATWRIESTDILSIAVSPDGTCVAICPGHQGIQTRDIRTGEILIKSFQEPTFPASSTIPSGNGAQTIRDSNNEHSDIWNAQSDEPMAGPFENLTGRVNAVAFSPDGNRLALASDDETVRVWDAHTGIPLGEPFRGHTDGLTSVIFSPDGSRIASASYDATVRVWDANTGEMVTGPFQEHTDAVASISFSPNGKMIASGSSDTTIMLWNAYTGDIVGEPFEEHEGEVNSVAFSPDGALIASCSDDGMIILWDPADGSTVVEIFEDVVLGFLFVAFSSDGTRVVSCSYRGIQVWDTCSGNLVAGPFSGHAEGVSSFACSLDGTLVVTGANDQTIRLWDVQARISVDEPSDSHIDSITSVTFSPDGTRIASGSRDHSIQVWDADTGDRLVGPILGHTKEVHSVAFSADGTLLASGSWDHTLRLWNAHTGTSIVEPLEGHTDDVHSVAFSPNGAFVASGSWDQTVMIRSTSTGEVLTGPLVGHTGRVHSVAFSPDSTRITSGSCHPDFAIRVWDVLTGNTIAGPFVGHTDTINSVAFSPDGTRIVSGSMDKTIQVWDAYTGDTQAGPYIEVSHEVNSVSFSPNGMYIASGSEDGTVTVWDSHTGDPIVGPLYGHTGSVTSVSFSPDSARLVSGSFEPDRAIRVWDLRSDAEDLVPDNDGWFMGKAGPLFWAPLNFHKHVPQPRNTLLIGPGGTAFIDYRNLLVGKNWAECYAPTVPRRRA